LIVPGESFTDGRLNITASNGQAPDYLSQGFGFMDDGSLAVDTDTPAGSIWNKGFRLNATGAVYGTTSTAGSDVWIGGLRVSTAGAVVYEDAAAVGAVNGDPYTSNARLSVNPSAGAGFDLVAGEREPLAGYYGADPTNIIGAGAFGSFDPGTIPAGYTLVAMYAFSAGANPAAQTSFTFQLSDAGGDAPSDAFESLAFVGDSGAVLLERSSADDPNGADGGTFREWTWSVASATYITTGNTYAVSVS
jgi:hypothetical protein